MHIKHNKNPNKTGLPFLHTNLKIGIILYFFSSFEMELNLSDLLNSYMHLFNDL